MIDLDDLNLLFALFGCAVVLVFFVSFVMWRVFR